MWALLIPITPEDPAKFYSADHVAEMLPFKDCSFDAIIVATSLDHVLDLPETIREIRRVAKPQAQLHFWGSFRSQPPGFQIDYNLGIITRAKRSLPVKRDAAVLEFIESQQAYAEKVDDKTHREDSRKALLFDEFHFRHLNFNFSIGNYVTV